MSLKRAIPAIGPETIGPGVGPARAAWSHSLGRDLAAVREYFEAHPDDLDAHDSHGHTPLGYLTHQGEVAAMRLLLELGADLTPEAAIVLGMEEAAAEMIRANPALATSLQIEARKYPLLWFAAGHNQPRIAALLLELGADVNIGEYNGSTPLDGAAEFGQVTMIDWLVERGGDVNQGNRWGITPLHRAAYRGHQAAAELLVAYGADPAVRSQDGETPADMAETRDHRVLADWLRSLAR